MKQELFTLYKIMAQTEWDREHDTTSTYSFGSLYEAQLFAEKKREADNWLWYSIREESYYPCRDYEPGGRLYIGIGHMEFHQAKSWRV